MKIDLVPISEKRINKLKRKLERNLIPKERHSIERSLKKEIEFNYYLIKYGK